MRKEGGSIAEIVTQQPRVQAQQSRNHSPPMPPNVCELILHPRLLPAVSTPMRAMFWFELHSPSCQTLRNHKARNKGQPGVSIRTSIITAVATAVPCAGRRGDHFGK